MNCIYLASPHYPAPIFQKDVSHSLCQYSSEEESRQMEEILRLEREIERLQRQRDDGVSLLNDNFRDELRQKRDAEIYQLEKEASRVATEFLEMLDFGGLEQSLSSEENLHDPSETTAPLAEEEVDEGFHADDECIPLRDFPLPAAVPMDKEILSSLLPPPPAFTEGLVATASPARMERPKSNSSIKQNRLSDIPPPPTTAAPPPPAALPSTTGHYEVVYKNDRKTITEIVLPVEETSFSILPDTESDYDQEEFEEALGSCGDAGSTNDGHLTDEEVLHRSSCTYNSTDSFRGSSDSVSSLFSHFKRAAIFHFISVYFRAFVNKCKVSGKCNSFAIF